MQLNDLCNSAIVKSVVTGLGSHQQALGSAADVYQIFLCSSSSMFMYNTKGVRRLFRDEALRFRVFEKMSSMIASKWPRNDMLPT